MSKRYPHGEGMTACPSITPQGVGAVIQPCRASGPLAGQEAGAAAFRTSGRGADILRIEIRKEDQLSSGSIKGRCLSERPPSSSIPSQLERAITKKMYCSIYCISQCSPAAAKYRTTSAHGWPSSAHGWTCAQGWWGQPAHGAGKDG